MASIAFSISGSLSAFAASDPITVSASLSYNGSSVSSPATIPAGSQFGVVVGVSCSGTCVTPRLNINLPAALTYVSTSSGPSTSVSGSSYTFDLASMTNGSAQFTLNLKFAENSTPNSTTSNLALSFGTEHGSSNGGSAPTLQVIAAADVTVATSITHVYPGANSSAVDSHAIFDVKAEIGSVLNNGPLQVENAVLEFLIPVGASLDNQFGDVASATYNGSTRTLTWSLGTITSTQTRRIKVTYPSASSANAVGDTRTYVSTFNGNKLAQSAFAARTASRTDTLRARALGQSLNKWSHATSVQIGNPITYYVEVANTGDYDWSSPVIEDVIPDGLRVTQVTATNYSSQTATLEIKSSLGADGIASTQDDNQYFTAATVAASPSGLGASVTVNPYTNVSSLSGPLPTNDLIIATRFSMQLLEYSRGPALYGNTMTITATLQTQYRNGAALTDQQTITNTATLSASASTTSGVQNVSVSDPHAFTVIEPFSTIDMVGAGSSPSLPTINGVGNTLPSGTSRQMFFINGHLPVANNIDMPNPKFIVTLPPFVSLHTWNAQSGTPTPTLTQRANYDGDGSTALVFTWPSGTVMPRGQNWRINYEVDFSDDAYNLRHLHGGTPWDTMHFNNYVGSSTSRFQCAWGWNQLGGDPYDLDSNSSNTNEFCNVWNDVSIEPVVQADITSYVKGSWDSSFAAGPSTGYTTPGNTDRVKADILNSGKAPFKNVVLVNRLTRAAQRSTGGSLLNASSQTFPINLKTRPVLPTLGSAISTYYSTATNPCLPEINSSPSGCSAPAWTNWDVTPPLQISDVTGLKFDFGSNVLNPNRRWAVEMEVQTPISGVAEADFAVVNSTSNPLNDETAKISFAAALTNSFNNVALPAAESQVVTLAMPAASGPVGFVSASPQTATGTQGQAVSHTITAPNLGTIHIRSGGANVTTLTVPNEGSYSLDPNTGTITFTPLANFIGTASPITYRKTGSTGLTADSTFTVTINATPPSSSPSAPTNPAPTPIPAPSAPSVPIVPGVPIPVTPSIPVVNPNQNQVSVSSGSTGVTLQTRNPAGQVQPLGPSGQILVSPGVAISIRVSGVQPSTQVRAFIVSGGQVLGTVVSGSNGSANLVVSMPATLTNGIHLLQLVYRASMGVYEAVSIPIEMNKISLTSRILFAGDSATLRPTEIFKLKKLASAIQAKRVSNPVIRVTGFVFETADKSYDTKLSLARARAIVTWLKKAGIIARFSTRSFGIAPERNQTARRADVSVSQH